MNNLRKIIEERLENARNDYGKTTREPQLKLKGQIEAYQDCLNLIPAPRNEAELIKEFEKLGYEVIHTNIFLILDNGACEIKIWKDIKLFKIEGCYSAMQEYKLLNELFNLWGWL